MDLKIKGSGYIQDYSIGCCVCCTPLMETKFLKTSFKDLSYFVKNVQRAQVLIHGCKNYRHSLYMDLKIKGSGYIQDYSIGCCVWCIVLTNSNF